MHDKETKTAMFLTRRQAAEFLGISESQFRHCRAMPGFPQPHLFGKTCKRWWVRELLAWVESQAFGGKAA